MQSVQKYCTIFSSSLPTCPIHIFSSVTQACFALITSYNIACFALVTSHNMPVICYIPLYTLIVFILCITWIQNMLRHDKVKINGANGQTGGKNRSSIFVFGLSYSKPWHLGQWHLGSHLNKYLFFIIEFFLKKSCLLTPWREFFKSIMPSKSLEDNPNWTNGAGTRIH
jgi:hypothetical protein